MHDFGNDWRQIFSYDLSLSELAVFLVLSVLLAGTMQLALPWMKLQSSVGWKWRMTFSGSEEMDQIKSLFWVGALGAAVGTGKYFGIPVFCLLIG